MPRLLAATAGLPSPPPCLLLLLLLLQIALKCADLGHLAAEWGVHTRWLGRLEEEFFRQGDLERGAGLPISPLFDRTKQGVSKSQVGAGEMGHRYSMPQGPATCRPARPRPSPALRTAGGGRLPISSQYLLPVPTVALLRGGHKQAARCSWFLGASGTECACASPLLAACSRDSAA